VKRLRWKGPTFRISGATGQGTKELCEALMSRIEEIDAARREAEKAQAQRDATSAGREEGLEA
jgi:GTP-binding protein